MKSLPEIVKSIATSKQQEAKIMLLCNKLLMAERSELVQATEPLWREIQKRNLLMITPDVVI